MDLHRDTAAPDDLSSLSWVQEELRKTLETAHKALRRCLREAESAAASDLDDVDPTVLRNARQQLHQGVGALELVNVPEGAALLRAAEALVQRFVAKPQRLELAGVEAVERASFALLDYLGRRLAGKPADAVGLFPQLRQLLELGGAERVHPADLWAHDFVWRDIAAPSSGPRPADAAMLAEFEKRLLTLVKLGAGQGAAALRADCYALAAGSASPEGNTFWRIAAAFFEAWALGLLPGDVLVKRTASRVLGQLRQIVKGEQAYAERLALDLLFYCALALPRADMPAPCLRAVRQAYGLGDTRPADYTQVSFGRFDPTQIQQARKRVEAAKQAWADVAAGELQRLSALTEPFSLAADSVRRLWLTGEHLAQALLAAAEQVVRQGRAPAPEQAMELATALLYVEAALEEGEFDRTGEAERVERLAQRLDQVARGAPAEPLDPWMEELYRRVADRQTMGTVVQELRASLSEAERQIDQYFRHPREGALLVPVPSLLTTMRGVLTVLGIDAATDAVLRMRDDVDALLQHEPDPQAPATQSLFHRLAANLGALGFLIDMLKVQPQMARLLFVFDADAGVLSPLMGRNAHAPDLVERAQAIAEAVRREGMTLEAVSAELQALSHQPGVSDAPGLVERVESAQAALEHAAEAGAGPATEEAAREHIAQAMDDFVATATSPIGLDSISAPLVSRPMDLGPPPAFVNTGLEDDDEMREVFLEESREVLAEARLAMAALGQSPGDLGQLTTVRRAFHTLKGSARMVGLLPFGEAAWSVEQLYNHWMASQAGASPELQTVSLDALAYLGAWVEAIEARQDHGFMPEPVVVAADTLRLAGELMRVPLPPAAAADAATLPLVASELPVTAWLGSFDRVDLDLGSDLPELPVLEPLVATQPAPLIDTEPYVVPERVSVDADADADSVDFLLELDPSALPSVAEVVGDLTLDLMLQALEPAADEVPSEPLPQASLPLPELVLDAPEAPESLPPMDVSLELTGPAQRERIAETDLPADDEDQIKVIGSLRLSIPLFNIYLNEADELSRRLGTELAEWSLELQRPVGQAAITHAHSLAGSSATVGFDDLAELARALEHALIRSDALGGGEPEDAALFIEVADDMSRLLHQFAAGFLRDAGPELVQRLHDWEWAAAQRQATQLEPMLLEPALPAEATAVVLLQPGEAPERVEPALPVLVDEVAVPPVLARPAPVVLRDTVAPEELDIDQEDQIDAELFPVFEEEAQELLPRLAEHVAAWIAQPQDLTAGTACMRSLHTFKGGARLAGAMRLGEMAHRFETVVQQLLARERVSVDDLQPLQVRTDALNHAFEVLRSQSVSVADSAFAGLPSGGSEAALQDDASGLREASAPGEGNGAVAGGIDWTRFAGQPANVAVGAGDRPPASQPVRVRIQLLDRLVNMAGEVSITRARLEAEVGQIRGALGDLTENLDRLHQQLHDIGLQAETQLQSRREAARASQQAFDPLEMDRYTRVQELTRMMAESVDDVATVRGALQRSTQSVEDELAVQGRLTRELQGDLLRTRMVEFDSLSERLYRVVRQAAKETGKHVRLDIAGGSIEVDRSVLDRMTAAFEHLLRNCVTHGVEAPEVRQAAGKDPTGSVVVAVEQEGNEVSVEIRDDGAGLDLQRIRERALAMGLLAADAEPSEKALSQLIFAPGLSTADAVTELAGRGVGMDVVRADVRALGGRIEIRTNPGRGTRFRLVLPLTTVVTQVVLLRAGPSVIAVPSNLIELVQRATPLAVETGYRQGSYLYGGLQLPFYWLGALLQGSSTGSLLGRTVPVVIVRSAQQRVALHVDEVLGTHEVVVKNLGPQLSRVPGLAGMTLLVSGGVALIYNPVALSASYGEAATQRMRSGMQAAFNNVDGPSGDVALQAPLVLVVDDSLTVRRVTKRLLEREGYRVALAKDGLEALDLLAGERPLVALCDIEMPRMDGFDLLRNIRSDELLHDLPVVMITSRIAEKHRDHALRLGANHYLGKPYSEEELIRLIRSYAS
ncbi:MAG: Hpt domain-containing protein [Burkholderiales bacterium]